MTREFRTAVIAIVSVLLLTGVACSSNGSAEGDVQVSLKDFDLTVSPTDVPAGQVTLAATNAGPSTHEFEVFSVADGVDANDLPVEDDVAVTDGLTLVDELEDVLPGSTASLDVDLEPGTYAVVCNLPEHYAQGMHATLKVT